MFFYTEPDFRNAAQPQPDPSQAGPPFVDEGIDTSIVSSRQASHILITFLCSGGSSIQLSGDLFEGMDVNEGAYFGTTGGHKLP